MARNSCDLVNKLLRFNFSFQTKKRPLCSSQSVTNPNTKCRQVTMNRKIL